MDNKPHPFAAVTPEIVKTMSRDGLIDWLVWKKPEDELGWLYKSDATKEELVEIVLTALNKKEPA